VIDLPRLGSLNLIDPAIVQDPIENGDSAISCFLEQAIHQGVLCREDIDSIYTVRQKLVASLHAMLTTQPDLPFATHTHSGVYAFTLQEYFEREIRDDDTFKHKFAACDHSQFHLLNMIYARTPVGHTCIYLANLQSLGAYCGFTCMFMLCHMLGVNCFIFEYDDYDRGEKRTNNFYSHSDYINLSKFFHYNPCNKINMIFIFDYKSKRWYNALPYEAIPYKNDIHLPSEFTRIDNTVKTFLQDEIWPEI